MQKVFKKSTFQALPSVLFFLRNEAQLSEKYQRRRPGWCKEKYYIKIQKYSKVPLTVSWLVHMSSARQRKVLHQDTEVQKSTADCVLAGAYVFCQARLLCNEPPLLLQPAFLESLRPSSTLVSKHVHSLNIRRVV